MSHLDSMRSMLVDSEFYDGAVERTGTILFDGEEIETIELVLCSTDKEESVAVFCASDESFIDIVVKPKVAKMRPR